MGCRPSKHATSKIRDSHSKHSQCACTRSPRKYSKKHRCNSTGNISRLTSSATQSGSFAQSSADHRSRSHRSDENEFPAFSTTTAVYRRSSSKASKITLRLSCDGSTLEIEQCDYDIAKMKPVKTRSRPRPWSSAPNLTKSLDREHLHGRTDGACCIGPTNTGWVPGNDSESPLPGNHTRRSTNPASLHRKRAGKCHSAYATSDIGFLGVGNVRETALVYGVAIDVTNNVEPPTNVYQAISNEANDHFLPTAANSTKQTDDTSSSWGPPPYRPFMTSFHPEVLENGSSNIYAQPIKNHNMARDESTSNSACAGEDSMMAYQHRSGYHYSHSDAPFDRQTMDSNCDEYHPLYRAAIPRYDCFYSDPMTSPPSDGLASEGVDFDIHHHQPYHPLAQTDIMYTDESTVNGEPTRQTFASIKSATRHKIPCHDIDLNNGLRNDRINPCFIHSSKMSDHCFEHETTASLQGQNTFSILPPMEDTHRSLGIAPPPPPPPPPPPSHPHHHHHHHCCRPITPCDDRFNLEESNLQEAFYSATQSHFCPHHHHHHAQLTDGARGLRNNIDKNSSIAQPPPCVAHNRTGRVANASNALLASQPPPTLDRPGDFSCVQRTNQVYTADEFHSFDKQKEVSQMEEEKGDEKSVLTDRRTMRGCWGTEKSMKDTQPELETLRRSLLCYHADEGYTVRDEICACTDMCDVFNHNVDPCVKGDGNGSDNQNDMRASYSSNGENVHESDNLFDDNDFESGEESDDGDDDCIACDSISTDSLLSLESDGDSRNPQYLDFHDIDSCNTDQDIIPPVATSSFHYVENKAFCLDQALPLDCMTNCSRESLEQNSHSSSPSLITTSPNISDGSRQGVGICNGERGSCTGNEDSSGAEWKEEGAGAGGNDESIRMPGQDQFENADRNDNEGTPGLDETLPSAGSRATTGSTEASSMRQCTNAALHQSNDIDFSDHSKQNQAHINSLSASPDQYKQQSPHQYCLPLLCYNHAYNEQYGVSSKLLCDSDNNVNSSDRACEIKHREKTDHTEEVNYCNIPREYYKDACISSSASLDNEDYVLSVNEDEDENFDFGPQMEDYAIFNDLTRQDFDYYCYGANDSSARMDDIGDRIIQHNLRMASQETSYSELSYGYLYEVAGQNSHQSHETDNRNDRIDSDVTDLGDVSSPSDHSINEEVNSHQSIEPMAILQPDNDQMNDGQVQLNNSLDNGEKLWSSQDEAQNRPLVSSIQETIIKSNITRVAQISFPTLDDPIWISESKFPWYSQDFQAGISNSNIEKNSKGEISYTTSPLSFHSSEESLPLPSGCTYLHAVKNSHSDDYSLLSVRDPQSDVSLITGHNNLPSVHTASDHSPSPSFSLSSPPPLSPPSPLSPPPSPTASSFLFCPTLSSPQNDHHKIGSHSSIEPTSSSPGHAISMGNSARYKKNKTTIDPKHEDINLHENPESPKSHQNGQHGECKTKQDEIVSRDKTESSSYFSPSHIQCDYIEEDQMKRADLVSGPGLSEQTNQMDVSPEVKESAEKTGSITTGGRASTAGVASTRNDNNDNNIGSIHTGQYLGREYNERVQNCAQKLTESQPLSDMEVSCDHESPRINSYMKREAEDNGEIDRGCSLAGGGIKSSLTRNDNDWRASPGEASQGFGEIGTFHPETNTLSSEEEQPLENGNSRSLRCVDDVNGNSELSRENVSFKATYFTGDYVRGDKKKKDENREMPHSQDNNNFFNSASQNMDTSSEISDVILDGEGNQIDVGCTDRSTRAYYDTHTNNNQICGQNNGTLINVQNGDSVLDDRVTCFVTPTCVTHLMTPADEHNGVLANSQSYSQKQVRTSVFTLVQHFESVFQGENRDSGTPIT